MIPSDFSAFVLDVLKNEGMVFAGMDWALFERGNRSWDQLKERSVMDRSELAGAIFTEASDLRFIEREPGVEHFRRPPRAQARFETLSGDSYWVCLEASIEQLVTRYYTGQTWNVLPSGGKVDVTTF